MGVKEKYQPLYQKLVLNMASYAYFDTKRKIKRHPEIGCIFHLAGCKMCKIKRKGIVPTNREFRWKDEIFLCCYVDQYTFFSKDME